MIILCGIWIYHSVLFEHEHTYIFFSPLNSLWEHLNHRHVTGQRLDTSCSLFQSSLSSSNILVMVIYLGCLRLVLSSQKVMWTLNTLFIKPWSPITQEHIAIVLEIHLKCLQYNAEDFVLISEEIHKVKSSMTEDERVF